MDDNNIDIEIEINSDSEINKNSKIMEHFNQKENGIQSHEETDSMYFDFRLICNENSYIISAKEPCNMPPYIVIPKEYKGLPVTHIESEGFCNCENLVSVLIPNTIKSINRGAFKGCINLSIVLFEEDSTLKHIGCYAFKNCKSLESIVIPKSVINIEENVFDCCISLQKIYITTSQHLKPINDSFHSNSKNLNIYLSKINIYEWKSYFKCINKNIKILLTPEYIPTSLGFFSFELNSDKKSYTIYAKNKNTIPENLVLPSYYNRMPISIIGENAFYRCYQIKNLKLPKKLVIIGNSSFSNCYNIKEIKIPDSVEKIDKYSFVNNILILGPPSITPCLSLSSLEKVIFSENSKLVYIGEYAFYGNIKLKEFTTPETLINICNFAFGCIEVPCFNIGKNVKNIGYNAFSMAHGIKKFIVDSKNYFYTSKGDVLYSNYNRALEAYPLAKEDDIYTIDDDVRLISGNQPFFQCENLRVLYINSKIVPMFFMDDPYISTNIKSTKIYVPDEVVEEYKNSYQWRYYTNEFFSQNIIKDGIARVGNTLIQWIDSKENITIPKDIDKIGSYALGQDKTIRNIYVEEGNHRLKSDDGVLFNIDKTELIRYPQVREAQEYEVPSTVKKLGIGSFIGGENLKSIKLNTNLEEIGEYALGCCTRLEKINLENIKKIGKYAFYYCNLAGKLNLNSIEILEECAFYRDLMYIDIDNSIKVCNCMDISEVVLGNNIQYIGRSSLPRGIVLYIYSPNPPTLASSYFQFSKIYVPSESVDLYKNSSNWENFKEIIYPIS